MLPSGSESMEFCCKIYGKVDESNWGWEGKKDEHLLLLLESWQKPPKEAQTGCG